MPKHNQYKTKRSMTGWNFVIIAMVLSALFMIYPIISSLILSTKSGKGIVYEFVGFGNVVRLVSDKVFLTALKNTFIYFIFQVPIYAYISINFC